MAARPDDGLASRLWVMRNARECAADHDLRSQAGIARRLGKNRSQVTRWENGDVQLAYPLIRAYEDVLDLPSHTLLMTMELLDRERQLLRGTALYRPDPTAQDSRMARDLLELALSTDRMTGWEWEQLAALVGGMPQALIRLRDWEQLFARLVLEQAVSRGLDWVLLSQAGARLAGHPDIGPIVAELVDQALADPGRPMKADTVSLAHFADPDLVADVLLKHASSPSAPDASWAVFMALTTMLRHGQLNSHRKAVAFQAATKVVRGADPSMLRGRQAAASYIASGADSGNRAKVAAAVVSGLPQSRREEVIAMLHDWSMAPRELASIVTRVLDAIGKAGLPHEHPQLRTLIATALGDSNVDSRGSAFAVLLFSGQGEVIGLTCREFAAQYRQVNHDLYHVALQGMSWLTPVSGFDAVGEWFFDPSRTSLEARMLAGAIAHRPEGVSPAEDARDERLLAYALGDLREPHRDDAADGRAWGVCYQLGLRGRFDLLERLAAEVPPGNDRWPGHLKWWLELPRHCRPVDRGRASAQLSADASSERVGK